MTPAFSRQAATDHRLKGLDGLRAIAILMVFWEHRGLFARTSGLGGYGVHLFFVLSGFLIIGILHRQRLLAATGTTSTGRELLRFYIARAFRIWPVYFCVVLAIVVVSSVHPSWHLPPLDLIALCTFTINILIGYVYGQYPQHYGHLWSISTEEQFYALTAPLILCVPVKHARTVCLAAIGLAAAYYVATGGNFGRAGYVGPAMNFGLMGLGGLFALRLRAKDLAGWWTRQGGWCLPLYLALPLVAHKAFGQASLVSGLLFWGSGLLGALVIADVASRQGALLTRALDVAPLRWLGRVSYGFYLFHGFIDLKLPGGSAWLDMFADFFASLAAASLSWMLFEAPILRIRNQLLHDPAPRFGARGEGMAAKGLRTSGPA